MAEFDLTKSMDDIADPQPLPEDWYTLEILDEPELAPNRVMRDQGPSEEDARMNIVLKCQVVDSPGGEHDGRPFMIYLSTPNANDSVRKTKLGQTYEDMFLARIKAHVEAFFGGPAVGAKANFEPGQKALFYVVQELSQDGSTPRNNIDINSKPRPVE